MEAKNLASRPDLANADFDPSALTPITYVMDFDAWGEVSLMACFSFVMLTMIIQSMLRIDSCLPSPSITSSLIIRRSQPGCT